MRIFKKKVAKNPVITKSEPGSLGENVLSDKQGIVWVRNKNGIYKTGRKIEKAGKKE